MKQSFVWKFPEYVCLGYQGRANTAKALQKVEDSFWQLAPRRRNLSRRAVRDYHEFRRPVGQAGQTNGCLPPPGASLRGRGGLLPGHRRDAGVPGAA